MQGYALSSCRFSYYSARPPPLNPPTSALFLASWRDLPRREVTLPCAHGCTGTPKGSTQAFNNAMFALACAVIFPRCRASSGHGQATSAGAASRNVAVAVHCSPFPFLNHHPEAS